MSFRKKILLICCICVLASSVVCSVAVYSMVKRISLEAAQGQGLRNAGTLFSELEEKMQTFNTGQDGARDVRVLEYLMKRQNDEMLLCFSTEDRGTEIFNSTVFQQDDLESLSYQSVSVMNFTLDMATMNWEGRHFLVFRLEENNVCMFYKLEDISYVWTRMQNLGLGLILLTFVITTVVCLVVCVILNRMLRPLKRLNEGAKQIAMGQYDERIVVEKNDEIGELSTNFNQMADAVQSRIQRLKETEQKRTLFMGNLTHELKTPMTAISGYAKTLLTVKLPEEDQEEALSYIYGESCRLERLSQKMMNLLLLEEEDPIQMEQVSAERLFHNVEEACHRSLEDDSITLKCHPNGAVFIADMDLMTEVLINLVDNARKASSPGSSIILSAGEKVIKVQDFGRGIPEEEQDKILEPFYRIDKSRSRQNGGAGLGLAITATILKRHNCTMQIESQVGEGSCMILQFV